MNAEPTTARETSPLPCTSLERAIIDTLQDDFPLQESPFATVATRLATEPEALLAALNALLERRMISRFGPLYNVERMGGAVTLAAMQVPKERFAEVAELVNAFPEVAHNYERQNSLNMWFVLATDSLVAQQHTLEAIAARCRLPVLNFPKEREFHIGFRVAVDGDGAARTTREAPPRRGENGKRYAPYVPAPEDRAIIRATQAGLPLDLHPYHAVAAQTGLTSSLVIARLQAMHEAGVIRRLGVVPNHYGLGLQANGMTVWDVADEYVAELGTRIGALAFVTHCYQRPRHLPLWPYNLFAMVHGRTLAEAEEKRGHIAGLLGSEARAGTMLLSTRILKKDGLRLTTTHASPPPC
ncbi:MAG: Lrp/AsnC family transcriptional regulator [Magnetococcales bacterium]|nr:Lrp/AsnC family transcriptional regulator [Magnetococcales bacterium]